MEDCVAITGTVEKRFAKKDADKDETRWDLNIQNYNVLNSSDVLSSQLESIKNDPMAEFPQQYRYLQLRSPILQKALRTRFKASKLIRDHLSSKDFIEIETPLLFKSTPEGAREFLVPTRKADKFYALPQSPQQYKQLLMASGVKNYFQIAKCFRDEDLRKDRQPEFTQVDLEMSFADKEDVQDVIESTVKRVWKEIRGEDICTLDDNNSTKVGNFVHLSYDHVLSKYGIDKPDLRSTIEIQDLSEFATAIENPDFPVFEVCILPNAYNLAQKKLPKQLFDPNEYKNRKPVIIPIKTKEDIDSWYEKFAGKVNFKDIESIKSKLNLQVGDVIAGSTRARLTYENPTPLGRFRQLSIQEFPEQWRHSDAFHIAAWIEDFPLFQPSEVTTTEKTEYPLYDLSHFESTHHPFTMLKPEDYDKLESDPLSVKGEHYDLVLNGVEVGGGSRRVHDSQLQYYIFEKILKINDPDRLFGHLLTAFKNGCPPHAGFAIGFDRLCAMLIGSESIRDVVAFPKTQNGSDMVVGSPSSVSDENLKEYHVKKIIK